MRLKLEQKNVIEYLKVALIVLLVSIEIVVCAQAYTLIENLSGFVSLIVCSVALAVIETVNTFVIKNFVSKMVFFGLDSALLLTICILTGNTFLSTLYCIVLTGCFITVDKFRDRTILFGVSCVLFSASIIAGWAIRHVGAPVYSSIVEILSGMFFGLVAMTADYIIAQFLLKFYKTNRELRVALKEAAESQARLEDAYEQLTRVKVYEERNRIAKDIHDNAGHSMTTVIMQTEAAKLLIDDNPQEAKTRIISANIQARNALEQMRESVHLLAGRTSVRSVREEMEEIIAQTIDGTDIKARSDLSDVTPTYEQYRYLCNSLKELLSNGVRHGKATAFYVELKESLNGLTLLVSDNGLGVGGDICEGFGLRGMHEKAEALGGSCVFKSEEGEGFEAEITLPIIRSSDD